MFDDIRFLEKNDYFNIYILEKTLTYKITDIRTVLPYEVSSLLINKDKDLVTLVTCTPVGINSHRLLVTGSRINTIESIDLKEKIPKIKVSSMLIKTNKIYLIFSLILLFLISVIFIIFNLKIKKK